MEKAKGEINKIVKEQLELMKTEEVLKKVIEKINMQINQLCVEELQLKSKDAEHSIEIVDEELPEIEQTNVKSFDEINKQILNLDVRPNALKRFEETDEDDEESLIQL